MTDGQEAGKEVKPERLHLKSSNRSAAYAESAQAGPCVLPVEGHGETLQELDGAVCLGLELACGERRRFGKLGPDSLSRFAPSSPHSFDYHRDESEALPSTCGLGVVVRTLEIFVFDKCCLRALERIRKSFLTQAAGDSEIPSSGRASPPPWDKDVSRAPVARVGILIA